MTSRKPGSANARPSGEAPLVVSSREGACHALKTGRVQSARDCATHHHLGSSPGEGQIAATPPTGVVEGKAQPVRLKSWAWSQHLTISATYSRPLFGRYLLTHRRPCHPGHRVNEAYPPDHTHTHAQKHKHTQTHGHTHTYVETHIHRDTYTDIYTQMHT